MQRNDHEANRRFDVLVQKADAASEARQLKRARVVRILFAPFRLIVMLFAIAMLLLVVGLTTMSLIIGFSEPVYSFSGAIIGWKQLPGTVIERNESRRHRGFGRRLSSAYADRIGVEYLSVNGVKKRLYKNDDSYVTYIGWPEKRTYGQWLGEGFYPGDKVVVYEHPILSARAELVTHSTVEIFLRSLFGLPFALFGLFMVWKFSGVVRELFVLVRARFSDEPR
ncbi:MAG: hypothetical protein EAZ24_15615 [Burkholderiales bacterium]|nr:MAG: hypothetical protein EAZ24_15615 [Burkholderiales bacterium]TAG82629.1 MAG: hypothetical protein EAZ21_03275 [Betaproteobacteria bacterium]